MIGTLAAAAGTWVLGLPPLASAGFKPGEKLLEHVSDSQPWIAGAWWSPSKAVLVMVVAAILVVFLVLRGAKGYDQNGVPKTRLAQMIDPFVEHFHREVAVKFSGAAFASKITPLLLSFFFFILINNLLGLLPLSDLIGLIANGLGVDHSGFLFTRIIEGSSTPTGNFNVTVALAVVSFFAINIFGCLKHGVAIHFGHLAPKGPPWPIRFFLLLPIETVSMFVKPFALTMRLAANMTAGHMGLLALLMMPAILGGQGYPAVAGIGAGIPVVLLATGIMMLEIIVCFVQAYVFALLTGVFIGMAIHSH